MRLTIGLYDIAPRPFDRAIGFVRPFSPDEIEVMAAAIGRTALHEPAAGFPHATLVP